MRMPAGEGRAPDDVEDDSATQPPRHDIDRIANQEEFDEEEEEDDRPEETPEQTAGHTPPSRAMRGPTDEVDDEEEDEDEPEREAQPTAGHTPAPDEFQAHTPAARGLEDRPELVDETIGDQRFRGERGGQITGAQAVTRAEQQARDAGLERDEFRVAMGDEGLEIEVQEGRVEQRAEEDLREDVADELGVEPWQVEVEQADGRLEATPTEEAQRELLMEEVEEEFPEADEEDIEITEEDGELVAEVEVEEDDDPALSRLGAAGRDVVETAGAVPFVAGAGVAQAVDDPAGAASDLRDIGSDAAAWTADFGRDMGSIAVDTQREQVELERSDIDAVREDPARAARDAGEDAAEGHREEVTIDQELQEIDDNVAQVMDAADERAVATGLAVAAVPEPTPATEAIGAATIGTAAAVGVAQHQREQGEVEVPEETGTVTAPEIETPTERDVVSPAEIDTPQRREAVEPEEVEVPEERDMVTPTEVEVPEDEFTADETGEVPTIQAAEQLQIGQQERAIEEEEEEIIITGEELVDPDELREDELEELGRQAEEQAEFARTHPDEAIEQEAFVFPGEPPVDQAQVQQPDVTPERDFATDVGTGPTTRSPAAGVGDIEDLGVGTQIDNLQDPLQDATPTLQAQQTAMQQAEMTVPDVAAPGAFGQPTAATTAEFPAPEVTAQATTTRSRRRMRPGRTPDVDDIDPAGDLDAAIGEDRVEFEVPDPDTMGIDMGDLDDFSP